MPQRRWPAVSARLWDILEARGHGSRVRFADLLGVDASNVTRWTRPDSGTDFPPELWDETERVLDELAPGELRALAGVSSSYEERLRAVEERLGRVETHLGLAAPGTPELRRGGPHLRSVDGPRDHTGAPAAMGSREEPRRETDSQPEPDELSVDDPGPDDGA